MEARVTIDLSEENHHNAMMNCNEEIIKRLDTYNHVECTLCNMVKKLLLAFEIDYAYVTAENNGHLIEGYIPENKGES